MRVLIVAIVAGAFLSACAPIEMLRNLISFQPAPDRLSFVYRDFVTELEFDGSMPGEEDRIERLEAYLEANDMCAGGYKITSRNVVDLITPEHKRSRQKTIYYHGECL